MNRPMSKGMWNLAKGSPSQQAVLLPKTYSDHQPYSDRPPSSPLSLVTGAKPQACVLFEQQQDQPFLRDPQSTGALLPAGPGTAQGCQDQLTAQGGTTGIPNQLQDSMGTRAITVAGRTSTHSLATVWPCLGWNLSTPHRG